MADIDLDQLLADYKHATDRLIDLVREQQSLAAAGQSMQSMEKWDDGWSGVQDAVASAKKTRDAYQNGLREKNYSF